MASAAHHEQRDDEQQQRGRDRDRSRDGHGHGLFPPGAKAGEAVVEFGASYLCRRGERG